MICQNSVQPLHTDDPKHNRINQVRNMVSHSAISAGLSTPSSSMAPPSEQECVLTAKAAASACHYSDAS